MSSPFSSVQCFAFQVQCAGEFGFRVSGSGFRVSGSGFRVQGLGFRVWGSGFRGGWRIGASVFPTFVCRVFGV